MPRPEKVAVVDEVREQLTTSAATILTEFRGLSVGDLADLRGRLRDANARYKIAKNTLTAIAADEAQIAIRDLLTGPTALVFCDEDPVGPAKALRDFQRDHPELVVKGGYLDGQVLDADATIGLADLQSREELLAELAGLMYGALANVARLLQAAPEKFARLLAALEDAGGPSAKGFGGAEEPAADQPAAEEPAAEEPAAEEPAAEEPAAEEPEAEGDDGGVVATVTEAAAAAVETAGDVATDAVATAAETAASAAETVADAAESAAETVAPDEDTTDDASEDASAEDTTEDASAADTSADEADDEDENA